MRSLIRVLLAGLFCCGVAAGGVIWLLSLRSGTGSRADRSERVNTRAEIAREDRGAAGKAQPRRASLISFLTSSKTGATKRPSDSWPRSGTWVRSRSCASRFAGAAAAGSPRCGRSTTSTSSTPRRAGSKTSKRRRSSSRSAFCTCTRGSFSRPPPGSRRPWRPARSHAVPDLDAEPAAGRPGNRRHAARRDRELPGVRRPIELHLPDRSRGRHQNQAGSREAIKWFTAYLEQSPRDLRVIWLLNIAYMTLGEHPDKVPLQYLLPNTLLRSEADDWPVRECGARGSGWVCGGRTWLAGASSTISTVTACPTCSPRRSMPTSGPRSGSTAATERLTTVRPRHGLGDQVYALNVTRADFDNDGDLDVLLLRGGWEQPAAALASAEQGKRRLRRRDGRQRAGRADRDRVGRLGRL